MYQQKQNISYPSQLGILIGLAGGGLLLGGILSVALMFSQLGMAKATKLDELFKPENINLIRWLQIISTLFLFFIPTIVFARIISKKPFQYLGYNRHINLMQVVLVALIMITCFPIAGALAELTQKIPLSPNLVKKFKAAEEEYEKQVQILMVMKNGADYFWSLLIIAVLPAIFEETIFRGGLQKLLLRWKNNSQFYIIFASILAALFYHLFYRAAINIFLFYFLLISLTLWLLSSKKITNRLNNYTNYSLAAILATSIIFSAVHFSYYGFLSRVVLGAVLGLIYYHSGNIWLNIITHLFYNGTAVTFMYLQSAKTGQQPAKEIETTMPLWSGPVALIILAGLLYVFIRISKPLKQKAAEEEATPPPKEDNWMLDN